MKTSKKPQRRKERNVKKLKHLENKTVLLEQDENFYYIAGYTSGGAPYGITWEQAAEEGLLDDSDDESDDTDIEIF
jgi:hypothetical protein